MEVNKTADKLAAYLSVENTYLTTFQALGGLGLVLGSLGLAVVLLRSIWEPPPNSPCFAPGLFQKHARMAGVDRKCVLAHRRPGDRLDIGCAVDLAAAARRSGAVPWRDLGILFASVLVVALTTAAGRGEYAARGDRAGGAA